MVSDPYKVLGIPKTATPEEIKAAYRKKSKECHPDLHPDDPQASSKMHDVNEAYDMLTHPEKYPSGYGSASSGSSQSSGQGSYGYGGFGGFGGFGFGFDDDDDSDSTYGSQHSYNQTGDNDNPYRRTYRTTNIGCFPGLLRGFGLYMLLRFLLRVLFACGRWY